MVGLLIHKFFAQRLLQSQLLLSLVCFNLMSFFNGTGWFSLSKKSQWLQQLIP
jgi:hypothetical protein